MHKKNLMKKTMLIILTALLFFITCGTSQSDENVKEKMSMNKQIYHFPFEEEKHEATWLTWPHHFTYGQSYRKEIEPIWVEMTKALHGGENIYIIAYNQTEQARIIKLLTLSCINMDKINFVIAKSDDVWVRDTGPIFVKDKSGRLIIANFAFDGWGKKAPFQHDDDIPKAVAKATLFPIIHIDDFVLEGGSVEVDSNGTAMLCKSSVISENRNSHLSQREAEVFLNKYLGVTNFIWLDGVINEDITDAHIDGIARFYDENTILTVSENDFFELYENIKEKDLTTLLTARTKDGKLYKIINLPLTEKNAEGTNYKGNYLNFYVANEVVLLPVYNDKNDEKAIKILEKLYQDKQVVPIDVTALYKYGGMLHCVTQQQPSR